VAAELADRKKKAQISGGRAERGWTLIL